MQPNYCKFLAITVLMNLAAYGQSVSEQSPSQQPSAQPSSAPSISRPAPSPQSYAAKSLGEIARENREKQAAQQASGIKPRVITNKDVPADPETPAERAAQAAESRLAGNVPNGMANNQGPDDRSAEQRMAQERAGEQWKRQIEEQQYRIANLQARIDRINASIRAVGGTVQYDQPYSRYEAIAQERIAQMQEQLDEQRRRLEWMQESARRAGMHTSVYDP